MVLDKSLNTVLGVSYQFCAKIRQFSPKKGIFFKSVTELNSSAYTRGNIDLIQVLILQQTTVKIL